MRIHPGIVAQAAATSANLLDGHFCLGVGSGEALNEHIFGDRWPEADERLEMLEEAVEVIGLLWTEESRIIVVAATGPSTVKAKNGSLVQGGMKVCWDAEEARARKTVHRLWPNEALPGELAPVTSRRPRSVRAARERRPGILPARVL